MFFLGGRARRDAPVRSILGQSALGTVLDVGWKYQSPDTSITRFIVLSPAPRREIISFCIDNYETRMVLLNIINQKLFYRRDCVLYVLIHPLYHPSIKSSLSICIACSSQFCPTHAYFAPGIYPKKPTPSNFLSSEHVTNLVSLPLISMSMRHLTPIR